MSSAVTLQCRAGMRLVHYKSRLTQISWSFEHGFIKIHNLYVEKIAKSFLVQMSMYETPKQQVADPGDGDAEQISASVVKWMHPWE